MSNSRSIQSPTPPWVRFSLWLISNQPRLKGESSCRTSPNNARVYLVQELPASAGARTPKLQTQLPIANAEIPAIASLCATASLRRTRRWCRALCLGTPNRQWMKDRCAASLSDVLPRAVILPACNEMSAAQRPLCFHRWVLFGWRGLGCGATAGGCEERKLRLRSAVNAPEPFVPLCFLLRISFQADKSGPKTRDGGNANLRSFLPYVSYFCGKVAR